MVLKNLAISDLIRDSRVCKRWHAIISNVLANKNQTSIGLHAYPERALSENESLDIALAKELKIKPNDVLGWTWLQLKDDSQLLRLFLSKLSNLRYIEIDEITKANLAVFEHECPKLEGLGFHKIDQEVTEMDWKDLVNIRANLTILACGSQVAEDVIEYLVDEKMMPNLRTFRSACGHMGK